MASSKVYPKHEIWCLNGELNEELGAQAFMGYNGNDLIIAWELEGWDRPQAGAMGMRGHLTDSCNVCEC